jgi:hypothetical protein
MAAPAIAGTPAVTNFTSASDPFTINLPASVAAGDGLLVFLRNSNAARVASYPGGSWQVLLDQDASDATDDFQSVLWLPSAAGGETSIQVDLDGASKGIAFAYRITGHDPSATPTLSSPAVGTDATVECNAVSLTSGRDYLVFKFEGFGGETASVSTWPTNYTYDQRQGNTGTGGTAATNARAAGSARQLTGVGSSETPGTTTWSGSPTSGWASVAVAIINPSSGPQTVVMNALAIALTLHQPRLSQVVKIPNLAVALTLHQPSVVQVVKIPNLSIPITLRLHAVSLASGPQSVVMNALAIPFTLHQPRLAYTVALAHVAIPFTSHQPRLAYTVRLAHVAIPLTLHQPGVAYTVRLAHLAVPVTLRLHTVQPPVPPAATIVLPNLAIPVTLYLLRIAGTGSYYFLPPEEPVKRVPARERLDWLEAQGMGSVPRSLRYVQFLGTTRGLDVEIDGTTYLGGRWYGPLSDAERTAIISAGYSDRLVLVAEGDPLPPGIP